jgi:hypothetical protein
VLLIKQKVLLILIVITGIDYFISNSYAILFMVYSSVQIPSLEMDI